MKKNIFLIIILIILSALGGAYFYISSKINPDELKRIAINSAKEVYPDLIIAIDKIDYEIGLNVKLQVKGLQLASKFSKNVLAELSHFEVRIPVWSILTSGGAVEIKANSPIIYFLKENKDDFNWSKPLTKKTENAKKQNSKNKEIEFPSFLNKSRINIKVEKAIVDYQLDDEMKGRITINQILIKNINMVKTTAFEIDLNLKMSAKEGQYLKSKIELIGEIDIGKYIRNGDIDFNLMCSLKENSFDGINIKIPNVDVTADIDSIENSKVKIVSNLKLEEVSELKLEVLIDDTTIAVDKLKSVTSLSKLVKLLPKETSSELNNLNWGKSNLMVDGKLNYDFKANRIVNDIYLSTTNSIKYSLDDTDIIFKINADLSNENLNFKASSEVLGANIVAGLATKLNLNNLPTKVEELHPIDIKINMNDLKLSKTYIQQKLYGAKKVENVEESASDVIKPHNKEKINLPQTKMQLIGKEIYVGDEEIMFDMDFNLKNNELKTTKFVFKWGQGTVLLDNSLKLINLNSYNGVFDTKLTKVNFISFSALFPPFLKSIEGEFTGAVSGKYSVDETIKYDIKTNFTARDGQVNELDLRDYIMPIIENFELLKGKVNKNDLIRSGGFKLLNYEGNMTEKIVQIKSLKLTGQDNTADMKVNGHIAMDASKSSEVFISLFDKSGKFSKILNSEIGDSEFPLLLKGKGFLLIPDQNYTISKLLTKKIQLEKKNTSTKVKNEIKTKTQQVQKEIESKVKEQTDKLMKGILKK
jgi:hypothetical protein